MRARAPGQADRPSPLTHAFGPLSASMAGSSLPLALLATASLIASPGPRHGARLIGRVRGVIAAATAVLLAAGFSAVGFTLVFGYAPTPAGHLSDKAFRHDFPTWDRLQLAAMSVVAVLVVAALSQSREGRRACALLAIAAVPAWGLLGGPFVTTGLEGLTNDNGGVDPTHSLAYGLVGFALTMLCVRLVELPTRNRAYRRQQSSA